MYNWIIGIVDMGMQVLILTCEMMNIRNDWGWVLTIFFFLGHCVWKQKVIKLNLAKRLLILISWGPTPTPLKKNWAEEIIQNCTQYIVLVFIFFSISLTCYVVQKCMGYGFTSVWKKDAGLFGPWTELYPLNLKHIEHFNVLY